MTKQGITVDKESFYVSFFSTLVLMVVFVVFYATTAFQSNILHSREHVRQVNHAISIFTESYFTEIANIVEVLSYNLDIQNVSMAGNTGELERTLRMYRHYTAVNKNILYIYSGYNNGLLLINDYIPPEGFDTVNRPWYKEAMQNKPALAIGVPFREASSAEWVVGTSKAFTNASGDYQGVIAIDCSMDSIVALLRERHNYKTQDSFVLDSTGVIIIHSDETLIGQVLPGFIVDDIDNTENRLNIAINSRQKWAHYHVIDSTGWIIMTTVNRAEVLRPVISSVISNLIILILLTAAFGYVLRVILRRRFIQPFFELGQRIAAIANAEPLEKAAYSFSSNPEVAQIAENIERLAEQSLRRAEDTLRQSEERYRSIIAVSNTGAWEYNMDRGYLWCSPEYFTMLGYDPKEFSMTGEANIEQVWIDLLHSEDRVEAAKRFSHYLTSRSVRMYESHFRIRRKDGSYAWIWSRGQTLRDEVGNPRNLTVGTHTDITNHKRTEEEVERLSFYDQLTGLYNRRFYEEELKRLDVERNLPISLIMLDVNGLKLTNDAFGHAAGDELLQRVAAVLKSECRSDEIVARIGGDEFIILLPQTCEDYANNIVSRINAAAREERLDYAVLSVSMGIGVKRLKEQTMSNVFKAAEDNMYRSKLSESTSMRHRTINIIVTTLYEKSSREERHSKRVSELCERTALCLGLSREQVAELKTAGLMHDIGKITTEDRILNKAGPLSDSEWLQVKRHPEVGYSILRSVSEYGPLAEYVLAHHERWDGRGYPKGLKGREIPLQARVIAIVDAYDAMTSDRPYRTGLSRNAAIAEIISCAGTQFDPDIVKVFVEQVLATEE